MKTFNYTINDELGIHARPAGLLVKLVSGYQSATTITKDGKEVDAKRIMGLMGLGATKGTVVTDEDEAVKAVEEFFKGNL